MKIRGGPAAVILPLVYKGTLLALCATAQKKRDGKDAKREGEPEDLLEV